MLDHPFYVYHEENRVMARRGAEAPVIAETCASPQEAHDKVQAIVNPGKRSHDSYGPKGFLADEFQSQISGNCEAYVTSAYAAQ